MKTFLSIHSQVCLGIAAFFQLFSVSLDAQAPQMKKTVAQDLAATFGFCYGQHLSLNQLRQMFPDLAPQVLLAEMQWNSAFKDAEEGIEARLQALAPGQWPDMRTKIIAQIEPVLKEQNSKATHEIAASFLEIVQQRAKGILDSPNREMLLASHPKFVKSPELEFAAGYTGTFSTKGHVKAKGVELTIRYPLSWKQMEAERHNIVQKWTSDGGHGNDIFMVLIKKLPTVPTRDESAGFFTESSAQEILGEDGVILKYTTGRLERLPVGIAQFKQTTKRLETTLESLGTCYYLICDDAFIVIQFMSYAPGGAEAREARMNVLSPLIQTIANSLVLTQSYK